MGGIKHEFELTVNRSVIELRCLRGMRIAPVMVFGKDAWCIFDFGRSRSLLRTRKTHSLCPYTRNFPDDPSGILRSAMTFLVTGHTRAMPRRGSRVKSVLKSSLGQIFFFLFKAGRNSGFVLWGGYKTLRPLHNGGDTSFNTTITKLHYIYIARYVRVSP